MACTGRFSHAQTSKLDKDSEELAQFERLSHAQTTELVKDLKELEQFSKRKRPVKHVERLSDAQIAELDKVFEDVEKQLEHSRDFYMKKHKTDFVKSSFSKSASNKDKVTKRWSDVQIDRVTKVVNDFEELNKLHKHIEEQQVRLCNAEYLNRAFVKRRVESYLVSRWKKNQENLGLANVSS